MISEYQAKGKELIKLLKSGKIRASCFENKRLYVDFSLISDLAIPMVVGYPAGCNLDCKYCFSLTKDFCSSNPMRFIPPSAYKDIESHAGFYSPEEAFAKMVEIKESRYISGIGRYESQKIAKDQTITTFSLRGCEATFSMPHLLGLLALIKAENTRFFLETNGILLGMKSELIDHLLPYKDHLFIGFTIKAGTLEHFEKQTNRPGYLLKYQYIFLRNLVQTGIPFQVTYMCGPCFGNEGEEPLILEQIALAGVTDPKILKKRDYIPFFVPEYKKKRSIQLKDLYNVYKV